jgi:hypothetical protein
MPPKKQAASKAKAKAKELPKTLDLQTKWGFDGDGNVRSRSGLEEEGEYGNLGALKMWERSNLYNRDKGGCEVTITTTLGEEFKFVSDNFLPVLWPEGGGDGENISDVQQGLLEGYDGKNPRTIGRQLEGRTHEGNSREGEEEI